MRFAATGTTDWRKARRALCRAYLGSVNLFSSWSMSTRHDPRFEAYIEKVAAFAKPILEHLRDLVYDVCPEARQTIKWSRPAFVYRGKILCIMSAYKAHCAFSLWRSAVVVEACRELGKGEEASGQFGRLLCLADLPPEATLRRYLATAWNSLSRPNPLNPSAPSLPRASHRYSCPRPSPPLSKRTRLPPAPLTLYRPASAGSTWPGSRTPNAPRPALAVWRPPSSG